MTRAIRISGSVLLAVLVAALGGCGGGGDGAADPPAVAPPAAGGGDGKIVIKDFMYAPATANVKLGESVTVTNSDAAVHTLTEKDGVGSGNLAKGKSFTFTPKAAGTYDYFCDIHQYMKGKIIVS